MNLDLSADGESARAEALTWLAGWSAQHADWGTDPRLNIDLRREFQRDAYDADWLVPSWPVGAGGHGVDEETELWIKLDFARRGAPKLPNVQGPGVIAHALAEFGTAEQLEHVKAVARGDVWWCLGMSEPGAGSDLASLRTRATASDSGYLIDGQKVWTSHAKDAAFCLLFARTGTRESAHRGISAFVVPMQTPGITVRAIEKIGVEDEQFCEVFFDSVVVPPTALLGALNGGWNVAMSSLSHERDMVWIMNLVEIEAATRILSEELAVRPRPELVGELGSLLADSDAIWLTGLRGLASRMAGGPGHETALLKLFSTETAQRAFLLATRACGPEAAILRETGRGGGVAAGELEALGATLYGGTSEVQRNIIGERVLGLPR